jgi:competence protein ComEC
LLYSTLGRCTLYYIAGLVLSVLFEFQLAAIGLLLVLSLLSFPLKRPVFELQFFLLFLLLGIWRAEPQVAFQNPLPPFEPLKVHVEVEIQSVFPSKDYYRKYKGHIRASSNPLNGQWVLLDIPQSHEALLPGDHLRMAALYTRLPPSLNPGQFDYGRYLHTQGVQARLRLRKGESMERIRGRTSGLQRLKRWAEVFRKHTEEKLQKEEWSPQSRQLFMALVFGYKSGLDPELKKDFQSTALMHLLAVSGLHLGLLLLFLKRLLILIPVLQKHPLLMGALLIGGLWIYAVLTGLAPSVIRAVVLFSALEMGRWQRRHVNSLHALVLAAFLTLLVDPSSLLQLGFQLSYAAVFFILWVNHSSRNWSILVPAGLRVCLSAQMGVLPLLLFYFHQFSASFLLSNLLALPLMGPLLGVLWLQLLVLQFTDISLIDSWLDQLIIGLGKLADWAWLIEDIPFGWRELILLYAGFLALGFYFERQKRWMWVLGLVLIGWQQGVHTRNRLAEDQSTAVFIPHLWEESVLVEKRGKELNLYASDTAGLWQKTRWATRGLMAQRGLHQGALHRLEGHSLLFSGEYQVIPLGAPTPSFSAGKRILWVQHSPRIHFEEALQEYKPDIVVADGSNAAYFLPLWAASCRKFGITFHATQKKGAFVMGSL